MQAIIKELLDHEGGVCVSLIFPTTYKGFAEKDRVRITMKNSLHQAEKALVARYDKHKSRSLLSSIEGLSAQIDLNHPPQGVGIFVTEGLARLIYFPFPVEQKVVLSDTFELQDILYNLDQLSVYYLLVLSKKKTRLCKGVGKQLFEVVDSNFPKTFEDPYEEDKTSYHGYHAKDPSQVQQKRAEVFIREVHHSAAPYIKDYPVVLLGLDKHISRYKKSGKQPNILGEIHATHDRSTILELSKLVWPLVKKKQEELEETLVETIASKVNRSEACYGIEEVLNKVEKIYDVHLVVERDFEVEGCVDQSDGRLLCKPCDPPRYQAVPNVVEHVVEKVIKRKHGKVDVVAPNLLKAYGGIVLITKK